MSHQQPARKVTRIQSSKERGNNNLHHNNNLLAQKMNRAKEQKEKVIKRAYSKKGFVDWELEYSEAIRAKTKEAVSDIFDACDQIERSEIAVGSIQDYKLQQ